MVVTRIISLAALFALAGCGSSETPEAAPGAVERTTLQLDRADAAERNQTIERIEDEAAARAADSKQRIEEIEQRQGEAR